MKNNCLKKIPFLCLILSLSSCATMKINHYDKKADKIQSISLFLTMIGRVEQPLFPLIDAAILNGKTNSIADQIMDMQKKNIDKYRGIVVSGLKKNFKCHVLYADSLHSQPGFTELKEKYNFKNALRINNEHYPQIITATEDINPFYFDNGNVVEYFKENANYKNVIVELGKKVNTDLIAVSFSQLRVVGVGIFGLNGRLRLDTYLFLFDKTGKLISDAHSWAKPTNISGKKIDEYLSQLDNLSLIIEPMINTVILNYEVK